MFSFLRYRCSPVPLYDRYLHCHFAIEVDLSLPRSQTSLNGGARGCGKGNFSHLINSNKTPLVLVAVPRSSFYFIYVFTFSLLFLIAWTRAISAQTVFHTASCQTDMYFVSNLISSHWGKTTFLPRFLYDVALNRPLQRRIGWRMLRKNTESPGRGSSRNEQESKWGAGTDGERG
jgi:hypothetical protein